MTTDEFAVFHNLKSDRDWKIYFRNNVEMGKIPVALYSCPICHIILWNGELPCPKCTKEINK